MISDTICNESSFDDVNLITEESTLENGKHWRGNFDGNILLDKHSKLSGKRNETYISDLRINDMGDALLSKRKMEMALVLIRYEVLLKRLKKSNRVYCYGIKKEMLIADLKKY